MPTVAVPSGAVPRVAKIGAPATAKKRGWLPVLTLLFLVSYGLMTMLIVEQGRTIESQRALIRELFRDSAELSATKKALQGQALPAQTQAVESDKTQTPPSQAQSPSTQLRQYPSTQAPSNQAPNSNATSNQAAANQVPSSQAGAQQRRAQNQSAKQKPDFKMPSKPEPDLVDDVRTLTTI